MADDNKLKQMFSENIQSVLTKEELLDAVYAMNDVHLANFYIRLSDRTYVVLKDSRNYEQLNTSHTDAKKMIEANIEQNVRAEYQELFYEFINFETLDERLKDQDVMNLEYQSVLLGWCMATVKVICRRDNKIESIMLLLTKLTESRVKAQQILKLQREAFSMLCSSKMLFIAIIQKQTKKTTIIQTAFNYDSNLFVDYDPSIRKIATVIVQEEREQFIKKLQYENIINKLRTRKKYTVTTFLQYRKGKRHRIAIHFSLCKSAEEYVIATMEDITTLYTLDRVTNQKNFEGFKIDCQYEMDQTTEKDFFVVNYNIANFKAINSIYGYDFGNKVLKLVQRNLAKASCSFSSVCRENADNFFGLCRKENYDFSLLNDLCKMKIENEDGTAEIIELFCGIYFITDDTNTIDEICNKARIARTHAEKNIGINTYLFSEQENKQYLNNAVILSAIPKAIQNKELVVYYQPIYDAKTGKIASAEALIRWNHPEKGVIPPGVFVPVMERTGAISAVDLYVGKETVAFQKERMKSGKKTVPISINMSRYDFLQDEYMNHMLSLLRETSELASLLRIEITESGFIEFPNTGEYFMSETRKMGIKTLIDDFGTGFSSITAMIERAYDIIKLDMSFARLIGKEEKIEIMLAGIIAITQRFNLQVVAEGVETREQYEFLRDHGCDYIQGYYFSKPLPQQEFEVLLDTL